MQRATTTSAQPPLTGESCEDCFDPLTADQISQLEGFLPGSFGPTVTTIEELCDFLVAQGEEPNFEGVISVLDGLMPEPSQQTKNAIEKCLILLLP